MGTPVDYALADLVAHSGPMRLIDRALEADASGMVAEVTIREDCLFFRDGGVGGWVGIEFMAQTVGAWAGWNARLRGEAPKMGFLLGTRRYSCSRPVFRAGERLLIQVRQEFWAESGMGQFACTISIEGETVASAALTVFEPPDGAGE
jgi:predicted hotdog family 3-hydroxylacyl-ACP dehydratase